MQHTQTNPLDASAATADPGRLLRLPAVLDLVGLGRSAWLERVRSGEAPRGVLIGRARLWPEGEIRAYIAARVREARGGAAQ